MLDRFHTPFVGAVALVCPAVGLLFLRPPFMSAGIGTALLGLVFGMEIDLPTYLASRYLGLRWIGTLPGVLQSPALVSGAVGPVLVGLAYSKAGGYGRVTPYLAALLVVAASALLLVGRYPYPPIVGFEAAAGHDGITAPRRLPTFPAPSNRCDLRADRSMSGKDSVA